MTEIVLASGFAWLLLAETLHTTQIVGGLVLVVGVALAESARVASAGVASAGVESARVESARVATAWNATGQEVEDGKADPGGFDRDPRGDQPTVPARR